MFNRVKDFITEKTKNPKLIITMILLAVVLGFLLFSNYGLYTRLHLEEKKQNLQNQIIIEERINDSLKNEIDQLKNNYYEIERVAREKYGMIKPGEKVYLIERKKEK